MLEKDFQIFFTKWIANNKFKMELLGTCAFELKLEKTERFNFKEVSKNQRKSLLEAKSNTGCYHKINDMIRTGKTRFINEKPFDCFSISDANAYVVIWFYKSNTAKIMYWIDIDQFLIMEHQAEMKSATEEEFRRYAEYEFNFR